MPIYRGPIFTPGQAGYSAYSGNYFVNNAHNFNNNFTLEITGTDPDSGEAFRYFWSESTNTFVPVPELATIFLLLLAVLIGRKNAQKAQKGSLGIERGMNCLYELLVSQRFDITYI